MLKDFLLLTHSEPNTMKKSVFTLLIILAALLAFVAYTFISTGFFREINNTQGYEVIAEIPMYGAEALTISYADSFMIVSQDDRGARYRGVKRTGGLFLFDLSKDDFQPKELETTMKLLPHGISLYKLDSNRYQLLVVNHYRKHTIEKFELTGDRLIHLQTFSDPSMVSPNDVVILNENQFYFTNDHGYTSKFGLLLENYLGLAVSNVVFFDGSEYLEVADGIAYANGINISKDRSQVLVASPRSFKLKYYNLQQDGSLEFDHDLKVGSGIDNIELDENGDLWMGSHPSLLAFTIYAGGKKPMAPSELITINSDEEVISLYENDGSLMSATSVVAPYKDFLFVGTVMDKSLLVLKRKGE